MLLLYIYIFIYIYPILQIIPRGNRDYRPRFGRSLARLRTSRQQVVKSRAKSFLKTALKEAADPNTGSPKFSKELNFWMKHADLEGVMEYLTI